MSVSLLNLNAASAADAAAGVLISLPFKRERDWSNDPLTKKAKTFDVTSPNTDVPPATLAMDTAANALMSAAITSKTAATKSPLTEGSPQVEAPSASKAIGTSSTGTKKTRDPLVKRQTRLEQNRRAAKESRHRKKCMIEELQRSVIFFSRANTTLKQQNDELSRLVIEAQDHVTREGVEQTFKRESKTESKGILPMESASRKEYYDAENSIEETAKVLVQLDEASRKKGIKTETEKNLDTPEDQEQVEGSDLPSMQPGSTMQAMASFQQAATAAMEEAMKGLKSNTGLNLMQLSAPATLVGCANAQQAYTDTMTAIAMQQAAAAAMAASAGHHQAMMMTGFPFMMGPMFAWQLQQHQQYQMLQRQLQHESMLQSQQETLNKKET